jgi:hypothetical protein
MRRDEDRGGMKTDSSGEQVTEEAPNLAQERTLGLHASKLLEERKGHDLRVRELFEGLVEASFGIEPIVSVVHSAEQNSSRPLPRGPTVG